MRNTYIYPPAFSMRIIADIFRYTSEKMPKFNSISISGYHMQEAGATADVELAYTLADGLEYLRTGVNSGMNIDDFAPSLLLGQRTELLHGDSQDEGCPYALGEDFGSASSTRRTRSRWHSTPTRRPGLEPDRTGSVQQCGRTCIEAMAAALGHTQTWSNALDEAIALPTEFSARIATNTQIFLQEETGICKAVDPWGRVILRRDTHQ